MKTKEETTILEHSKDKVKRIVIERHSADDIGGAGWKVTVEWDDGKPAMWVSKESLDQALREARLLGTHDMTRVEYPAISGSTKQL